MFFTREMLEKSVDLNDFFLIPSWQFKRLEVQINAFSHFPEIPQFCPKHPIQTLNEYGTPKWKAFYKWDYEPLCDVLKDWESRLIITRPQKARKYPIVGVGEEIGGGLRVLRGSICLPWAQNIIKNEDDYLGQRSQMFHRGILADQGENLVFTQDFFFDSPSAAASIISGSRVSAYKLGQGWQKVSGEPFQR